MTGRSGLAARVTAGLALLMLVTAAALLASAVRNWTAVALALTGLLVATIAAWYVVSRRGIVRWLDLTVMAGAAALLIWSVVVADLRPLLVLPGLGCAAVSAVCARMALGRVRGRHGQAGRAAPRPARPVLIMNPRSGGGKTTRFGLVAACEARGIVPVVLQPGDDLTSLAEAAVADGADVIGMAGGDGSQALVAAVAAAHGIAHLVVPAGTRNHFALDIGLDREDVIGALDAFTDGVERRVDLAELNGRVFVNNASLGIYAQIVQSPGYRNAKLTTAAGQLPALLGPGASQLDLRFTGPDGTRHPTAHLILVSNNPYQLDHIGARGTRERIDGGVLGVVTARIDGPVEAERFVRLEAVGQVRRFEGWLEWKATRFEVGSAGPVAVGIDGEALTVDPPLVFSVRPGALRVRVPRDTRRAATGVISRSALGELLMIAAGHDPAGGSTLRSSSPAREGDDNGPLPGYQRSRTDR